MKGAQTVWITGASSGIGEALALTFNAKGYQTILSARRSEVLQSIQATIGLSGTVLPSPLRFRTT